MPYVRAKASPVSFLKGASDGILVGPSEWVSMRPCFVNLHTRLALIRVSPEQRSKFQNTESCFLHLVAIELLADSSLQGSSFPSDVDSFSAWVQHVNRIMGAMDQGTTVLLINATACMSACTTS